MQKRCYPPVLSEVLYEHSTAAGDRSASGSAPDIMQTGALCRKKRIVYFKDAMYNCTGTKMGA